MQIKTGLTLAAGIGIGMLVGMSTSIDTRDKCIQGIKRKIVFALTGEEWPVKKHKNDIEYNSKHSNKSSYKVVIKDWITIVNEILRYDDEDKANSFINKVIEYAEKSGITEISVSDLVRLCGKLCDYSWDKYGWTLDEFRNGAYTMRFEDYKEKPYVVLIGKPYHVL